MNTRGKLLMAGIMSLLSIGLLTQTNAERSENIKALIKKNHIEDVEIVVHRLAKSNDFLNILLKNGHHVDIDNVKFKKKDISIGEDIDIFVTHFTEHQTFTLLMLPVSFYNLSIYDTLLFASLEVSNEWLENKFHQKIPSEEARAKMLASETHILLKEHIANQAGKHLNLSGMGEMKIRLHETYVSASEVTTDLRGLSKEERELITSSWSLIKKSLSHSTHLNIESNVYVFGVDDMDVTFTSGEIEKHFKVTPANIFQRHGFSLVKESDGR